MSSISRRKFLGETACTAMTSVSVMNMILNLKLANQAAAQTVGGGSPSDTKTLVCVFLHGGMDSYNLLVPRDTTRHGVYTTSRSNLALPLASLKPLTETTPIGSNLYGLHPSCTGLQELFNGIGGDANKRRLAFISNVGTLVQPTTKADYLNEIKPLPKALFSHSDQIDQWQTSVPQGLPELSGWAGRAADVLHSSSNSSTSAMSISLAGNNVLQIGNSNTQFVVTETGALSLTAPYDTSQTNPLNLKNTAYRGLIEQEHANLIEKSYANLTKNSLDLQQYFQGLFNNFNDAILTTPFPDNYIAKQFQAAAKIIFLRQALGLKRQTIFISMGGWDHHSELINAQAGMLAVLSGALTAFQKALEELNLADSVITFTGSDFGRTMRSNGAGSDHAWGGNAMIMGGSIKGGKVYGNFPDQTFESNDDVGYGGRFIPSTSVDAYFYEMLRWFGVSAANMSYVLPNIGNFHNPYSNTLPLNYLKPGTWT
jgi:uncharacterized protein (DUF1501 family)